VAWFAFHMPKHEPPDLASHAIAAIQKVKETDMTYAIEFAKSSQLTPLVVDHLVDMTRENIKEMSETSGWGWDARKKKQELEHSRAQFLFVISTKPSNTPGIAVSEPPAKRSRRSAESNTNTLPIAFAHFRFDREECVDILYLYELQVSQLYQGKRIGQQLIEVLREIAQRCNVDRIVLTVLKCNERGIRFYQRLGFKTDCTCPSLFGITNVVYEILSLKV
jgi:ribosomal protein S18 acetylase RimI-like enzyme